MDKLVVTDDTEFYGFLNGMKIEDAEKIAEILHSPAICSIYENDTFASVVEEIIKRHGTFYTGIEAKEIAPWEIRDTTVFVAKFHYIEGDIKSTNPAYKDFDWCVLDNIQYGNRSFWCRGYYVDTVGKNAKRIEEYIKNQLKEDQINEQMTFKGMEDPFTGSKK